MHSWRRSLATHLSMIRKLLREDLPVQITIANLIGFALTFLSVPLITRSIGAVGRGETAAALAAFAILPTVLALGLPLELRRRSARGLDIPSVRTARDLILLGLIPALAAGVVFVLTIYANVSSELRLMALLGMALAPMTVSWSTDAGTLMGLGRYRAVALLRIAHPALTFVVIATSAGVGALTPPFVLVANIAGAFVTAVCGWILCRASIMGARAPRLPLLSRSARYAGSSIAESASSRLDQVLVLPLIGAQAAGFYSTAAAVAMIPLALGQALAADHFRVVASCDDSVARQRLTSKAFHESWSVLVPFCVLFTLIAAPAMPFVFGREFAASSSLVWVLLPGSVALATGFVASMLLAAQGKGATMTVLQVGGLAMGVAGLFWLGPIYGAVGAALASSVSYLSILVGQMIVLRIPMNKLMPTPKDFLTGLRSLW